MQVESRLSLHSTAFLSQRTGSYAVSSVSTASGSMVKHGGRVADAWADPVQRSRPGEDLLLCKESEDAELQSGDRYCR
jgi:hypothetical protein